MGSPAGVARYQTRGLGEATSNNRVPEGLKDGGRRSVDAAGTRTAAPAGWAVGNPRPQVSTARMARERWSSTSGEQKATLTS